MRTLEICVIVFPPGRPPSTTRTTTPGRGPTSSRRLLRHIDELRETEFIVRLKRFSNFPKKIYNSRPKKKLLPPKFKLKKQHLPSFCLDSLLSEK